MIYLQRWIGEANSRGWNELIEAIDHDPWGRPYRLVLGKLRPRAPPLTESLVPMMLERVLSTLFPQDSSELLEAEHRLVDYDPPAPATRTELQAAVRKMTARNTAPGPDGIPCRALAQALQLLCEKLLSMFNQSLRDDVVPRCWKTLNLVLLPKPGKCANSPLAYRPICLLNETGKLFERILMSRLSDHHRNVGPDIQRHNGHRLS